MDILGIQEKLEQMVALLNQQQDRIAQLEAQVSKDLNAVVDKVLAAMLPEVQAMRGSVDQAVLVVSASATEAMGLVTRTIARLDGAGITLKLGPDPLDPNFKPEGITT
jgi:hypothetical protein